MDHNWGRQVAANGLIGTGCYLAARFLSNPQLVLTNFDLNPNPYVRLWGIPTATSSDPYESYIVGGTPPFPYGNEDFVEPDFPV